MVNLNEYPQGFLVSGMSHSSQLGYDNCDYPMNLDDDDIQTPRMHTPTDDFEMVDQADSSDADNEYSDDSSDGSDEDMFIMEMDEDFLFKPRGRPEFAAVNIFQILLPVSQS